MYERSVYLEVGYQYLGARWQFDLGIGVSGSRPLDGSFQATLIPSLTYKVF
jgi:hypothetical protein